MRFFYYYLDTNKLKLFSGQFGNLMVKNKNEEKKK